MKANRKQSIRGKWSIVAFCALGVMVVLFIGAVMAYNKLHALWLEQCVIHDVTAQVSINSGKMVKADIVAEEFGLKNGANLGMIDYAARRAALLKKVPNIRMLTVTRHLPDKVTIHVEERRPEVRVNVVGVRKPTVRVADADGMVFRCQRDTSVLPVVREHREKVTPIGQELKGRVLAALRLIEVAKRMDAEGTGKKFGVLEVDTSRPDYLRVTFADYSQAKVAWDGMDQPTEANQKNLVERLTRLRAAFQTMETTSAAVWNATLDGKVFLDGKEP